MRIAQAVDNWDMTVCGDWADKHQLVPDGTDCLPFDHAACNLGYTHREKVCTAKGVCATGCLTNIDCPDGTSCSGNGNLGNCGRSPHAGPATCARGVGEQ